MALSSGDMDDQSQFQKNTHAFLEWLDRIGVKLSPKAVVTDLTADGRGRALVAKGDFEEDELIFRVPRESTLSVRTALPELLSQRKDISPEIFDAMPNWAALTAVIMSEAVRPDSKWAPYFGVLPIELDSLVFWTPSELSGLQASAVVNKIGKSQAEDIFRQTISKVVPEGSNLDFFHKVASTIMAYAFDIPEGNQDEEEDAQEDDLVDDEDEKTILSMIPLADMLNADADNNARLHYDGEELEMRAIKAIKSGEEILNDYGQLPRSDLLRRYGYITDKYAIYDVVELSATSIVAYARNNMYENFKLRQTSTEIDARVELAIREDVYEDSYDIIHANEEWSCIPDELVALVWLLVIDKETLASIQSSKTSLPSRSKMETELVGKVLQSLLKRREQEYATTASQDDAILQDTNPTYRTRMAIKVRQGEKHVLSEALGEAAKFQGSNKRMLGQAVKRGREDDGQKSQKRNKHR